MSGRGRIGAAGLLAAALGAWACQTAPESPPGVITVAIAVSPNNLDPRIGSDEASQRVHQLLYSSLVRLDEQLRVVPELATRIETPDPLTYVVHLRPGVRFHDGRELTADDVVYTFASFLDPDFFSPRRGAYGGLASVRARDPLTVEFKLREPFWSFPINLVMGIVPAGADPDFADRPIGTGPYRLVAHVPDDRIVLAPFEEHWAGEPRNEGLVLRVVPDDTMRGLELRKGTVDVIVNDLSPDIVHQLVRDGRVRVAESPGADYAYIGLNLRDPVLSDVRVRHAIGYAVDREAIVEHLRRGLARPAIGILPPVSWAFEPDVFAFTHDPDRARRLLDEAGYPAPPGDPAGIRLRLTLKTSTAEFVRLQAAVIQANLREIGIALEVRSQEFATLYADVLRGQFQMFTLQWVGVSDPDMLRRVFHSSQMPPAGFNRGFFSDPDVDRLIDAAGAAEDERERLRLYGEVQRRVARAAPYISLWYKTNVAVFQPSIEGVRLSPTADFGFLKDVRRGARAQAAG